MSIEVTKAVEVLRDKAKSALTSADALRYSQAANNLANTRACMVNTDKFEKE